MTETVFDLASFPVQLGLGATAVRLDEFDGTPRGTSVAAPPLPPTSTAVRSRGS